MSKSLVFQSFVSTLLNGITTVFGWVPAAILMILAWYGVATALLFLAEIPVGRILLLVFLAVAATAGFIALTSVCWGLLLPLRWRFYGLLFAVVCLVAVLSTGALSGDPLLRVSARWTDLYLFICPLVIGIVCLIRDGRRLVNQKPRGHQGVR